MPKKPDDILNANTGRALEGFVAALQRLNMDKLSLEVKDVIRNLKLLSDKEIDAIDNAKELSAALKKIQKDYEAARKINKEYVDSLTAAARQFRENTKQYKALSEAAEIKRRADLKAANLTVEQANALEDNIVAFRKHAGELAKHATTVGLLKKEMGGFNEKVGDAIKRWGSLAVVLSQFRKGITATYDQMVRLTNKGLLGAIGHIDLLSIKLKLLPHEFEEMINANRDLINQLGGGVEGISKFSTVLSDATEGLEYLGRDAAKAAEKFVRVTKGIGLTPRDGEFFKKNIDNMKTQFKLFNSLFGDTYDQYSELITQLSEEETLRSRMNGMSKKELDQTSQEIMKRAENLKFLGMSNEQILTFNKSLSDLMNPKKNNIVERRREAAFMGMARGQMMSLLAGKGDSESQRLLSDMQNSDIGFRKLQSGLMRGGSYEKLMNDKDILAAIKVLNASQGRILSDDFTDMNRFALNNTLEKAPGLRQIIDGAGGGLVRGEQQHAIGTLPKKEQDEIIKKAQETSASFTVLMQAASSAAAALSYLSTNPFITFGASLGAFALYIMGIKRAADILRNSLMKAAGAADIFSDKDTPNVFRKRKRGKGGGRGAGKILGPLASGLGKILSMYAVLESVATTGTTSTEDYEKRFGISGGTLGRDLLLRSLGFASDLGNNLSFGVAGNFYRDKMASGQIPPASISSSSNSTATIDQIWPHLIHRESGGNQSAVSSAGAIGIAQIMPTTGPEAAKAAGVEWDPVRFKTDAKYNEMLGKAYFAKQLNRFGGDPAKALAAYNAGPERVQNAIKTGGENWLAQLPAETRAYVPGILSRANAQMSSRASNFTSPVKTVPTYGVGDAPPSGASSPTSSGDPVISELQKQTSILSGILGNTSRKTAASESSYQRSPNDVAAASNL